MTVSITIRPGLLSETASLEVLFEALDEHHRLALPEIFRKPPEARRERPWLEKTIAGPDSTILVAEGFDRSIVGLAVLATRSVPAIPVRDTRRFVEIVELVVSAQARDLGVGRSLIKAAQEWACERDIPALEVSAWSFNREATGFYRKMGFQPTIERFALESDQPRPKRSSKE
jgi:ribosomal protein S18 acetylase RimI-like enzyme